MFEQCLQVDVAVVKEVNGERRRVTMVTSPQLSSCRATAENAPSGLGESQVDRHGDRALVTIETSAPLGSAEGRFVWP